MKYSERVTIAIDIGAGGGAVNNRILRFEISVESSVCARRFSLSNSGFRFRRPGEETRKAVRIPPGKISPGHLHYLETIMRDIEVWSECNCADKGSEMVVNPRLNHSILRDAKRR